MTHATRARWQTAALAWAMAMGVNGALAMSNGPEAEGDTPTEVPVATATSNPPAPAGDEQPLRLEVEPIIIDQGRASWYGPGLQGRRTASGERFDMNEYTAAHRTLPFGTVLRVQSTVTGKTVDVRVNDRGPYTPGLIIDLSRAAAQAIGLGTQGVKDVVLSITDPARAAVAEALMAEEANKPPRPAPLRRKVLRKRL